MEVFVTLPAAALRVAGDVRRAAAAVAAAAAAGRVGAPRRRRAQRGAVAARP